LTTFPVSFGALAFSFVVAALVTLACGKPVIAYLAASKARQPVSGDAPASHQVKHGTPTMGGLLIIAAVLVATVIAGVVGRANFGNQSPVRLALVVGAFLLAGGIGLLDDLGKARKKQNKAGLSERAKLGLQLLVSALFMGGLALTERGGITTYVTLGGRDFNLGLLYYLFGVLYICLFGNAVNFTDGLDGLASGVTLIAALALGGAVGVLSPEIGLFYGAVAGGCAGFLWFNAHPARVFMGDTGSLALGMGLAAAALAAKQEILLLVVGLVYLAEMASMMLQRYVFKYRRIKKGIEYAKAHRVFRRAPLHHHFEELGWPETHVVARFCIAGLVAAALGLLLLPYLSPLAGQLKETVL